MKNYSIQFVKIFFLLGTCLSASLSTLADGFYANEAIQLERPAGFAVQPESAHFVALSKKFTLEQASKLLEKISEDRVLITQLQNYSELSPLEQIPILKSVFEIQVAAMGVKSPKLVLDLKYPRGAFFEFDLDSQEPGTVYINPAKTYADNPVMSLSLLVHETRHSLQLQMAQAGNSGGMRGPMASAYFNAFFAQKELAGKLSFSDFLTLNNEYEAFLFGNFFIHKLFAGRVDMISMGSFASQFDKNGALKIDLDELHKSHSHNTLIEFNIEQQEQARLLGVE